MLHEPHKGRSGNMSFKDPLSQRCCITKLLLCLSIGADIGCEWACRADKIMATFLLVCILGCVLLLVVSQQLGNEDITISGPNVDDDEEATWREDEEQARRDELNDKWTPSDAEKQLRRTTTRLTDQVSHARPHIRAQTLTTVTDTLPTDRARESTATENRRRAQLHSAKADCRGTVPAPCIEPSTRFTHVYVYTFTTMPHSFSIACR